MNQLIQCGTCKEHHNMRKECPYCLVERLKEAIAIGTKDNPDFGDYSKSAMNFHDAWQEAKDKLSRYSGAVEVEGRITSNTGTWNMVLLNNIPIPQELLGQRVKVVIIKEDTNEIDTN